MKRFIITEEEKKHIMNLYEETTGKSNSPSGNIKLPKTINIKVKQDNGKDLFLDIDYFQRTMSDCFFSGYMRGDDCKSPLCEFTVQYGPFGKNKIKIDHYKTGSFIGSISPEAAKELEKICTSGNDRYSSAEEGGSSNYV